MADNVTEQGIILVGGGKMAGEYARVLEGLDKKATVVCRRQSTALQFAKTSSFDVCHGGLSEHLEKNNKYSHAIVAVNVAALFDCTLRLIQAGVPKILVEKPGALELSEMNVLEREAKSNGVEVYIGYNRRHLASVQYLINAVEAEGGITSIHFDFTEWADVISSLDHPPRVKQRWVLCNSSHVIDLAFFICGGVRELECSVYGQLDWHSSGSMFTGFGSSKFGAMLSYRSDWTSSGRWGIDVYTKRSKYQLRPLERLSVTPKNELESHPIDFQVGPDATFKPGLYNQTKYFLSDQGCAKLCCISEHIENFGHYTRMAGYSKEYP